VNAKAKTRTQAERVYHDVFSGGEIGRQYSRQEIEAKSGLSYRKVQTLMAGKYGVKMRMLKAEGKLIRSVRGEGYGIVHPREAADVIEGLHEQAGTKIERAGLTGGLIDRRPMEREERQELDLLLFITHNLQAQFDEVKRRQDIMAQIAARHDSRIAKLEEAAGLQSDESEIGALQESASDASSVQTP
jgi:hypothetical protein